MYPNYNISFSRGENQYSFIGSMSGFPRLERSVVEQDLSSNQRFLVYQAMQCTDRRITGGERACARLFA
jgi:hypothetical protein